VKSTWKKKAIFLGRPGAWFTILLTKTMDEALEDGGGGGGEKSKPGKIAEKKI